MQNAVLHTPPKIPSLLLSPRPLVPRTGACNPITYGTLLFWLIAAVELYGNFVWSVAELGLVRKFAEKVGVKGQ